MTGRLNAVFGRIKPVIALPFGANNLLDLMAIGAAWRPKIIDWNFSAEAITAAPELAYEKGCRLFRRLYEQSKDIAREFDSD